MIIQHRSARICGEAMAVAYTGKDPIFVCKDGPVVPFERVRGLLGRKEI